MGSFYNYNQVWPPQKIVPSAKHSLRTQSRRVLERMRKIKSIFIYERK